MLFRPPPGGFVWSELPRPLLKPALDHYLLLGEELNRISSLTMHVTEEAILPTAEGEEGHWSGDANINADVAGIGLIAKASGDGAITGKQASHISVLALVHQVNSLIDVINMHHPQDRAKNLRPGEFSCRWHIAHD